MICFLRPHLLCFSHSSRWLAQGREKETERAEGRPGERAAISQGLMFPWQSRLRWDKRERCGRGQWGVGGVGYSWLKAKRINHTHTLTCMGTHNRSVMVECICVTDRQVRGLVVTWLSVELCHSYLLWPLTSIPPRPLCVFLWCIHTNVNAQAIGEK